MAPDATYRMIHDELYLDSNPAANLASFVTSWMEPQAEKLMKETLNKNCFEEHECPRTSVIQRRCVNMLAHLFHCPDGLGAFGTGTVGSSEAIHLAGLALKWNWRKRRSAQGLPIDQPNIVMSRAAHVCCENFARYFDVELRHVPLTTKRFTLGVEETLQSVDENTIGVIATLGNTYTGEYDPAEQLSEALVDLNHRTGWNVPIHIDAATGGFVAPFTSPELKWDFRLPLVASINVSGHNYGLVYPGVGWVIWRSRKEVPDGLAFNVKYLGDDQPTFSLNLSRSANQIIAQYYNLLRFGREGYERVIGRLQSTADHIAEKLTNAGKFHILSKIGHLPVVTFALNSDKGPTVFDVSQRLRQRGWIVPAYTLPPDAQEIAALRVVVRENLSRDMADMFIQDLFYAVECLETRARFQAKHNVAH
jgi:glutamate decarboxylase